MTTSINTLPRLRTVATPSDVADLAIVQCFAGGALNPGHAYPGREADAGGWDVLSMEGPHRSTWHLTGYRLVGQAGTRAVYVFRFFVESAVRYCAAVVDVARVPARVVVTHVYDYQPREETTRTGAEEKAAAVLAELQAKLREANPVLTDDELAQVAVGRYTRLTVDQVAELLTAPAGPRIYALWREQIVSVRSEHYLDRYRDEARAWWLSGTTLDDLVRRA